MIKVKGRNQPLVKAIAALQQHAEATAKYAGMPNACVRAIIKDVDDPLERGRVRVVFDDFNRDIPQVQNAGDASKARIAEGDPQLSHWIDVSPSFKGKQPKGMVGKHCNITISNGQYQYAVLGDVLYDPEIFTEEAGKELKQPNNSSMTRMPIYKSGTLPSPCEENHGCTVIETGGPYGDDWLCVCLRRSGTYIWVRHIDMQHGHAGSNDYSQMPDTGGDKQQPIKSSTVWDFVFPTSIQEMKKYSAYDTKPRGNPWSSQVKWFPPPESTKEDIKKSLVSLLPDVFTSQTASVDFTRQVSGYVPNITGSFNPVGGIPINNALPYPNFTF
jgi:hypothetical protein